MRYSALCLQCASSRGHARRAGFRGPARLREYVQCLSVLLSRGNTTAHIDIRCCVTFCHVAFPCHEQLPCLVQRAQPPPALRQVSWKTISTRFPHRHPEIRDDLRLGRSTRTCLSGRAYDTWYIAAMLGMLTTQCVRRQRIPIFLTSRNPATKANDQHRRRSPAARNTLLPVRGEPAVRGPSYVRSGLGRQSRADGRPPLRYILK